MPTAVLEIVGEPNLALLFGEEQPARVLYREMDGSPISGETLTLAMVGRANDASLSELEIRSGDDGEAGFRVMAGTVASAFSVRVSAPRAAPILIGVAVSDAGFGGLSATVEWEGMRLAETRRVAVFTGMTCDDEDVLAGEADREKTLVADEVQADFLALPAGLVYAVTAAGLGATGEAVAWGCTDEVIIEADLDTETTVVMTDLPLDPTGSYSTRIELDAESAAGALSRAITRGGRAPVESAGGDAAYLLDRIEYSLRDGGDDAAADSLAAERSSAFLDDALTAGLAADDVGPGRAVDALSDDLSSRSALLAIDGRVSLSDADPRFEVMSVVALDAASAMPPLSADFASLGISPMGRLAYTPMPDDDTIVIDEIGTELPLGRVALAVLGSLVSESPADDLGTLLEERAGCTTLATWAAAEGSVSVLCDDACIFAACQAGLEALAAAIEAELGTLDAFRSDLSLMGTVDAVDEGGDLSIDVFSTDAMTGQYRSADGADSDDVTAAMSGARLIE